MTHPMKPPPIRFRFAPIKCLQAVQWMLLTADKPLDFQTILKAAYFADKRMLNERSRPVFGATYRAMNDGPVPVEIYQMLICEPYYLSEIGLSDYPWRCENGYWVKLIDFNPRDEILNPTDLSKADLRFLAEGFERSRGMSFHQRTEETHQIDWVRGIQRPDSRMAYEDMIAEDHPHREEMIEDLASMGVRIVL